MKSLFSLLTIAIVFASQAADYTLDFTGATPLASEAPILRKAEMAAPEVPSFEKDDVLNLSLFEDVSLSASLASELPSSFAGGRSFAVKLGDGVFGSMVLVSEDGIQMEFRDFSAGRVYNITIAGGRAVVEEVDMSHVKHGDCIAVDAPEPSNESEQESTNKTRTLLKAVPGNPFDDNIVAPAPVTVDIMLIFDNGAQEWINKSSKYTSITNFAIAQVAKMNTVLRNTDLHTNFWYRLVDVATVDSRWSQVNILDTIRNGIINASGIWSEVAARREACGADLVSLIIDTGSMYGVTGIGYITHGTTYNTWVNSFRSWCYSCCAIRSVDAEYTLCHEVGHNMGLTHSPTLSTWSKVGTFVYSNGYNFTGADGKHYNTVMAYNYDKYYSDYREIPYFCSPDYTYAGVPLGTAISNDCTRALRQTCVGIADWHAQTIPLPSQVVFAPSGTSAYSVTLSNIGGYEIRYTTDGSEPTHESALYTEPLRITCGEMTIKAVAVIDENTLGSVVAKTYAAAVELSDYAKLEFPSSSWQWGDWCDQNGNTLYSPFWNNSSDKTVVLDVGGRISVDRDISIDTLVADGTIPLEVVTTDKTLSAGNLEVFGSTILSGTKFSFESWWIHPESTVIFAPGANQSVTISKSFSISDPSSTLAVTNGTVLLNGNVSGGNGVAGKISFVVENDGNLVFDKTDATGYEMNTSKLTVNKGGVVTFKQRDTLRRTIYLNGGKIRLDGPARFDWFKGNMINVTDDSSFEDSTGKAFVWIRKNNATVNVARGKTFTMDVAFGSTTGDTSSGLVKTGEGEMVANKPIAHSQGTIVKNGTLTVGYTSSDSTGTGWTVASGATLKIKSGASITLPSLTLAHNAALVLPATSSAPLTVGGKVDMTHISLSLVGAEDLSYGATYPLVSAADITGIARAKKSDFPALATGLAWKLYVDDKHLFAKVVTEAEAVEPVVLVSNNPDLLLDIPRTGVVKLDNAVKIETIPLAVDGLDAKAVAITLDVEVPERTGNAQQTLCSWIVVDGTTSMTVRCVRKPDGTIDCYYNDTSHSPNLTNAVELVAGRHLVKIAHRSDGNYCGTVVLVDDVPAYCSKDLKWSSYNIKRVTIGATADETPTLPFNGLVVRGVSVVEPLSTKPIAGMTSSADYVTYNYLVPNSKQPPQYNSLPSIFGLTPAGGFSMDSSCMEASFTNTYTAASVSIVASFPEDAVGSLIGMWIYLPNGNQSGKVACQAEYRGDGAFIIRYDGNSTASLPATILATPAADVSKPHLYTLVYISGIGVSLYQDNTEILLSEAPYNYSSHSGNYLQSPITFGCGPWHVWRSSTAYNPNPLPGLKVYASHIALGADTVLASSDPVMESLNFDSAYDGMTIAQKLSYLPEYQTSIGVAAPSGGPVLPDDPDAPEPIEPSARIPIVDILVAYDNGAKAYIDNKGLSMEEFAQAQIDKMNEALITNRLDNVYGYRLAGVCRVDTTVYTINSISGSLAEGSEAFVTLRSQRELCGADTVTLLVNNGNEVTLGYGCPLSSSTDIDACHDDAFSVCSIRAVHLGNQHTMLHENAHNMGCGHADNVQACSPFSYGRGFYFDDPEDFGITRHTIMAYGGDDDASWYFSTTNFYEELFNYEYYQPTEIGDATHDNRRVLTETCGYVANWRDYVKPFDDDVIATDAESNAIVSGRVFKDSIAVSLAHPDQDAAIFYTLDGSTPNNLSAKYTEPFVITSDTVLKVAWVANDVLSPARTIQLFRRDNIPSEGVWQTGAKYPWAIEGDTIRSYNCTDYKYQCTTPLKATVVGPKILSFKYKSYFGGESIAINNYSHFDVLIDDSPVITKKECNTNWAEEQIQIPEGAHEVTFVFSQRYAMNNPLDNKDGNAVMDDAVWLKDIVLGDAVEPEEPVEEPTVDYVIFSNTNSTPDRASFDVSGNTVKISIPAIQDLAIATGALVRVTSLDFGKVTDANNYSPAEKLAISDGTTTWTSTLVVVDETDRFPKMSTNDDVVNRLVYSFAETNCILTVGTQYELKLLNANGEKVTNLRYALAKNGDKIITGMDSTSSGNTYTPMMQLKGEVVAYAPYFDWTPGENPSGWFTAWQGENSGSTHVKIGPDGLPTNLYVTYVDDENDDTQKWIPWKSGNLTPDHLDNYTFLAYGNIDDVKPAEGKLGVLWDMGFVGEQKTMLVKDSAGNVKLVQANGNTVNKTINAGQVEGYHLFTVRFSTMRGASLQIDNGEVYSDATFTQVSDKGLQIGSLLGGIGNTQYVHGFGFAVLKVLAFNTDSIPSSQYDQLCAEYPAVTNHVLMTIDGVDYYRLKYAVQNLKVGDSFSVSTDTEIDLDAKTISSPISGEVYTFAELGQGVTIHDNGDGTYSLVKDMATDAVLRISEIMPKPTDAQNHGALEGMDVNGLESGWVEVENTSDKWADLANYRFISVKRGKKTNIDEPGNLPSRFVPPHSRTLIYTSERYPNSDSPEESAFQNVVAKDDRVKPVRYTEYGDIIVYGKKVNPKRSPFVRLYYMPDAATTNVVDTVVIPSDLPEGWSIIVGDAGENEGTRRWMCPTPTRGEENSDTANLKRLGPNVGPLYEISSLKKTDVPNEFVLPVPPAKPGEDYTITVAVNPVMNPDGTFKPRNADGIKSLKLVYRSNLDDSTLATNNVDLATKETDKKAWGDKYTASIPQDALPETGHLIQWKFLIEDNEGTVWTSPSFNNPDDGYEWYGTIVEAPKLESANLPTWHMFAAEPHLTQMDKDKEDQDLTKVPNYARIAIYDSSTSNYYDYVRIDLRGNTSAGFKKKGHGLRFAKAHPLTMTDVVTGEQIEEIRKTSLISEYADPSFLRQMLAFWLWRKMGNLVPFDFPVRCNLNGEFYQLAFNSERFTDELIEDVYGLDKYGYSYKNVGTLKSGSSTTAGGIEKKTPDDEDESNITVLQDELRSKLKEYGAEDDNTSERTDLTKFVVEKFDLPAWINYLASARITQEMDDVWANVCIYYDNALMHKDGGVRGTDTWKPLGYDFNLSFGQWHYNDLGGERFGLMSNQDWFKSHPFYGGNRVRCYKSAEKTNKVNYGNSGFEAVWQSPTFRRLYLRRLRTLMDQELKAPGTLEGSTPFMFEMRKLANLMRSDAKLDQKKWPNNTSDNVIQVWTDENRPEDMDAGIDDIWENYVLPRRTHLYVTHSVTNTAKQVGYGTDFNAGIPESQSPFDELIKNITVDFSNLPYGVVIINNTNEEVVDMSGWTLKTGTGKKDVWTLPAGAVCDALGCIYVVADRRAYIEAHAADLTNQVIIGNATFGSAIPEEPLSYPEVETSSGTVSIAEEPVVFSAETEDEAAAWVESLTPEVTEEQESFGLTAEHFKVEAKEVTAGSGVYQTVVALNPDIVEKPAVDTTVEEPLEIVDDTDEPEKKKVSVSITNAIPGLWYGYEVSDSLGDGFTNDVPSFERATDADHKVNSSPRDSSKPSGFFRVKVLPVKPQN